VRKRNESPFLIHSPQPWTAEFDLSGAQKDSLIRQQAAEIERLRARWHCYYGALERIKVIRPEDASLIAFCQATLDGKVKFAISGRGL